jgi:two-component system, OmpR family, copper resistance phosphate regulon response regulator CusR
MRILVVEDDEKVSQAVVRGLEAEGYQPVAVPNGEEAFFLASEQSFALILLDLMLPGRSGIEVLKTLRRRAVDTPVLMLTAKDAVEDRIAGLDAGADDYLVKPFAFPELLARIRALLRRGSRVEAVTRFALADLQMDLLARKVERGGQPVELTQREFELLEFLLKHQGQVVSREMLARDVWHEVARATSLDNVIDVHIARLRKKVDRDGLVRLIHTVRGVGFVVREEA